MKNNEILYSINADDIQGVAREELSRKLTPAELKKVGDALGSYIDWHLAVELAIRAVAGDEGDEKAPSDPRSSPAIAASSDAHELIHCRAQGECD